MEDKKIAQLGKQVKTSRPSPSEIAVLHIPHSSRYVPADERQSIRLNDEELNIELLRMILQNGPAMRAAQERTSKRIVNLLGLTLGCHDDAPLAPDTPSRVEATRKKSKAVVPD
jgi:hypothetical protein